MNRATRTNGSASKVSRAEIDAIYATAREWLLDDGYSEPQEIERLAAHIVQAYLVGRIARLTVVAR